MLTLPDTLEDTGYRISASLFDYVPERLRGHLDIVDPEIGVEGWAPNLDSPDHPVTLELPVRERVAAKLHHRPPPQPIRELLRVP